MPLTPARAAKVSRVPGGKDGTHPPSDARPHELPERSSYIEFAGFPGSEADEPSPLNSARPTGLPPASSQTSFRPNTRLDVTKIGLGPICFQVGPNPALLPDANCHRCNGG